MSDRHLGAVDLSRFFRNNYSFSGKVFSGIDVEDMDLSDGDFSGAIFTNCSFKRCDFSQSTFDDCTLDNCWFYECCLEGTNFNDIDGQMIGIYDGHTEGMILTMAQVENFFFEKSSGRVNFCGSYVSGAFFKHLGLWQSDFREARVDGQFEDCDFSECVVDDETNFEGSEFRGCTLTDFSLTKTTNGSKVSIFDGVIMPAIRYGRDKLVLGPGFKILSATESLKEKFKGDAKSGSKGSGLSIYGGISYSAELICSNLEEFRKVK